MPERIWRILKKLNRRMQAFSNTISIVEQNSDVENTPQCFCFSTKDGEKWTVVCGLFL
ncbi:MAG TPA: hypothetical protein VE912_21205 [Bacteroidales bacterium]|nr:hypothetical protein [Bacteroidales bacterium]